MVKPEKIWPSLPSLSLYGAFKVSFIRICKTDVFNITSDWVIWIYNHRPHALGFKHFNPQFQSNISSTISLGTLLRTNDICLYMHQNRQFPKSMHQSVSTHYFVGNNIKNCKHIIQAW